MKKNNPQNKKIPDSNTQTRGTLSLIDNNKCSQRFFAGVMSLAIAKCRPLSQFSGYIF
jgi:hypothetical protein